MKNFLRKPIIFFVIISIGIAVAIILINNRPALQHSGGEMLSRSVKVINVQQITFRAKVTAYGNVEPTVTLKTLAEVRGKISYVHPDLKRGNSIAAGTMVARIDAEDYKVILKQTQADLRANKSALKQLQVEQQSSLDSIKLASANLKVGEKELQRIRSVWQQRLIARSTVDAEEQKVLQLSQQVSELQGKLNTFDSRKISVQAKITRAEQQVKNQKTTLGRTEISLPFTARIGRVSIEKNQFVNTGSLLFEALDIKGVEINAQLPIRHMRSLVSHLEGKHLDKTSLGISKQFLKQLNLTARVKLVGDMPDAWWDANVLRFSESVDPTRRTLGIVVGVDRPYDKIIPNRRPPLLKGMFTAVDIYAPQRQAMVIPRKAVHQGQVYLVNKDNHLKIQSIEIQQQQGDLVVVRAGLQEGDKIIIHDLVPVIEGMPLTAVHAVAYEKTLRDRASGKNWQ